jgi:hypothetical protein
MRRYSCRFLYKYKKEEVGVLLSTALKMLGFAPMYMDIFYDEFQFEYKNVDDLVYDEKSLLLLLKREPASIRIKSQLHDENEIENYYWFKLGLSADPPAGVDICSLEWSNVRLDFLFESNFLNFFISFDSFISGYCYDQIDNINQTNDKIESFKRSYPHTAFKTTKNFLGDNAIDISEHWGRYVNVCGIFFIAAPLIWFGQEFYKIIPKENLLKFKYASLIKQAAFDMVHIELFNLYDDPSHEENRNKQKDFWKFFDLQNKIEQCEKENPIDFVRWMQERALKKRVKNKSR